MSKHKTLTEGNPRSILLRFTIPILLSLLLQITYGTVDLLVVGQFSTVGNVSAVSIGSQVMASITSFFTGMSAGTTILLGQYIGRREPEKTTRTVGVSVAMFGVLAVFMTVLLVLLHGTIAGWMNTPTESFAQTSNYLLFTGMGAAFIIAYNLLGSIFRGIGDSKTPLIAVAIACLVNIALDLLLVAVFQMGATGAAIATTLAQGSSVGISLLMLRKKELPFTFSRESLVFDWAYIKRLTLLGLPIALQNVLVSVSFLVVTAIINVFGVAASAAVGIVEKITGIVMIVPLSFTQSLSAFTAQNNGAGKQDRSRKALFDAMVISLCFGIIMAYLSVFHGTIFTRLFTKDVETTAHALLYLKAYSFDIIFVTVLFSFTGYYTGCGKTGIVMAQAVLGAFCVRIPLAFLLRMLPDTNLFFIGLATPSSTVVQIIFWVIYDRYYQKKIKEERRLPDLPEG